VNAEYHFGIFYVIMGWVMYMRRWILFFFLLITLIGCEKKDELTQLVDCIENQTFVNESNYLNCQLELTTLNNQLNRYRVIINQPKKDLNHVKAFVVCKQQSGSTIPSIGFYENDNCNLYINKIDVENNFYEGVTLMGLTKEQEIECYLYLSYIINNEKIEEYILLEGFINDAS